MEQKNISFGFGIQRSPSLATDPGELSESINLIPKNGELVNIKPPVDLSGMTSEGTFRYVHHTSGDGDHYIFVEGSGLVYKYYDESSAVQSGTIEENCGTIKEFTAMGNFLIANTDDGIVYYLWKNDTEGYQILRGQPDLGFYFQLTGNFRWRNYTSGVEGSNITSGEASSEYTTPVYTRKTSSKAGASASFSWDTNQLVEYTGLTVGERYVIENNLTCEITIKINGLAADETVAPNEKSEVKAVSRTAVKNDLYVSWSSKEEQNGTLVFYVCSSGEKTDENTVVANTQANYEAIFGSLSNFNETYENIGKKFVRPFLVRYGFRMYDGSVLYQSAPMLMLPNNGVSPAITMSTIDTKEGNSNPIEISAFVADLQIKPFTLSDSISSAVEKWKDIITGIVVAVSAPIDIYKEDYVRDETYNDIETWKYDASRMTNIYGILEGTKKLLCEDDSFSGLKAGHIIRPPYLTDAEFGKKVYSTSEFYIIKEYTIAEIETLATDEFTTLDSSLRDAGGSDVVTLPSISDDYGSMINIYPEHVFTYNNRLDVANLKYEALPSIGICSPLLSTNARLETGLIKTRVVTYLKINGKEVVADSGWFKGLYSTRWIFFPHKRAYKYIIFRRYPSEVQIGKELFAKYEGEYTEHKILNGAYAYFAEEQSFSDSTEAEATADYTPSDNYIPAKNSIFVSNAGNPLYLPLTNAKAVGSGEIYTISTSARALSSGTQFGSFPLYAFCSDGIWPLAVASDGTFDAPNPLSRDVIVEDAQVCQVDSAVAFPTKAGLKVVSGQEVVKASGSMEGYNTNEEQFFSNEDLLVVTETDSIVDIISSAYILYDYANSLLHIYPKVARSNGKTGEDIRYKHYVFSLEQKCWSTVVDAYGDIKAVVPGYPFSYIQLSAGQVMLFTSDEDLTTLRPGEILTRPIAFDAPFSMKVLGDLSLVFSSGGSATCKIQPYVSNDRVNWYKLTSLRSRAFKWFRFRIVTSLTDLDALTGMSCMVEERRTNKLR